MKIFNLPDLGEGLAEAEIHEWFVKEGDIVKEDQPLVSLETAKAVVEVPSPQDGKIEKLYKKVGDIVKTHSPLLEFEEGEITKKDKGTVVGQLEENESVLNEGEMIIGFAANKTQSQTMKIMPAVRALAKQLNVNLSTVVPSGAQGQITADDVKKYAAKEPTFRGNVEAIHSVRRFMAISTAHAHQEVASVTIIDDADITEFPREADFSVRLIQAIVAGAKAEPSLNAWFDEKNMERCLHQEIHLGLAMDTTDGLFVPVIKNAEMKSPEELRAMIETFKKSVRSRTIAPNDLQGGTLTLSNFGTIAGRYATPMVIPPTVAILGSGKIRDGVGVHQGNIAIRRMMPLSLTFDHRAVTGGEASRFLAAVINSLEKN
jgi:2-oxoisovalerate dehydrogenase E2 component (dihydrolipoyl transacylase)